jgi:hypothetical protein
VPSRQRIPDDVVERMHGSAFLLDRKRCSKDTVILGGAEALSESCGRSAGDHSLRAFFEIIP